MCRDFVRLGSRPGELGDEGNGDRNGDCMGLLSRLALLRAAKTPVSTASTRVQGEGPVVDGATIVPAHMWTHRSSGSWEGTS